MVETGTLWDADVCYALVEAAEIVADGSETAASTESPTTEGAVHSGSPCPPTCHRPTVAAGSQNRRPWRFLALQGLRIMPRSPGDPIGA